MNMYECRVLYIGSAPPVETLKGIEALQEPLRQRYPENLDVIEGIDATLRVLPTALEVTYTFSGQVIHFPLDRMTICAGVRAVSAINGSTGEKSRHFAPVNAVESDSVHPTIFAAIIRRSKGRQIAECHMFICKSTRDALHLVNAAATANIALKKRGSKSRYEHEIPVVYSSSVNGYGPEVNGRHIETYAQNGRSIHRSETTYVKSGVEQLDAQHYQIKPTPPQDHENDVIYITLDKTNLKQKGQNTLELQFPQQTVQRDIVQHSNYVDLSSPRRHVQPYNHGMQNFLLRPIVAPQPINSRLLSLPIPTRQHFPQRIYAKCAIATPPLRLTSQPPVFYRSRARSTSPIRDDYYTKADIRPYQRMWSAHPKSETIGSHRDFIKDIFLDESAFSHRTDNTISRAADRYYYPMTYDHHSAILYDRPTTKSNPKYSSSSSSDSNPENNSRFQSS